MLKKSIYVAFVMMLCSGSFVKAACTPEEAQGKAQEFMNAAIALAQKDPQRYQLAAQAMQNELPELQKANEMDKLCNFYDEWLAKMK